MITDNDNNWHYLVVKRLSKLFRGMTSNNNGGFYCLNCLRSFRTKNKLETHKKIWKDHDFRKLIMPNENNYIIIYIPGEKSLKVPFIIYADLECLLQKIKSCQNNPEKSYTKKKAVHKPSGYSLITCCSFDK